MLTILLAFFTTYQTLMVDTLKLFHLKMVVFMFAAMFKSNFTLGVEIQLMAFSTEPLCFNGFGKMLHMKFVY